MPRRRRFDAPGRLHHVLARGHDRRRIFEFRADYRFFLALLVCAVHAGRIRVHAYTLMPNHFHLLVESVDGDLSATMQWLLGRYGGYFNRTRKHTGHAFEGRYHSFPVSSRVYLFRLVGYIDRNAVRAGLCRSPLEHEYGSARHHARPGPRPRWLERSLVDRFLPPGTTDEVDRRRAYLGVFHARLTSPGADELVESRLSGMARGIDELDVLLRATPEELGTWLAGRADDRAGPSAPLAMVDPGSALAALTEVAAGSGSIRVATGSACGRRRRPWRMLEAGLLRDLGGLTYTVASRLSGVSVSQARERYRSHRSAIVDDHVYRRLVGNVARRAVEIAFGDVAGALGAAGRPGWGKTEEKGLTPE